MTHLLALRDRIDLEIRARREKDDTCVRQRGGLVERDGPRYRNPHNSAETWSGRGTRPDWLRRALAAGSTLAELVIVGDRPVQQRVPA
jgi:DNA-binding protein H-NS